MKTNRQILLPFFLGFVITFCQSQNSNNQIQNDKNLISEIRSKFDIDINKELPFKANEKIKHVYISSINSKWNNDGLDPEKVIIGFDESVKAHELFSETKLLMNQQYLNTITKNLSESSRLAFENLLEAELLFNNFFELMENWNKTKHAINNADAIENCNTEFRIRNVKMIPVFLSNMSINSKIFATTINSGNRNYDQTFISTFKSYHKEFKRIEKSMKNFGLPAYLRSVDGEEMLKSAKQICLEVLEISKLDFLIQGLLNQNIQDIKVKNIDFIGKINEKELKILKELNMNLK